MNEITPVAADNSLYSRYEKLLIERDSLVKQSEQSMISYNLQFGELITEIFRQKIACIQKKKEIAFCQLAENRGEPLDFAAMTEYIEKAMAEYRRTLNRMIEENEACKAAKSCTEFEVMQIKKIYRRIAKLIHPDMNPVFADVPAFTELWGRVTAAYNGNCLKDLQELEILVNKAIADIGGKVISVEIPDLEEKISALEKEIDEITSTDPYCYKFLLSDVLAVKERENELNEQLERYKKYEQELKNILKKFAKNGVILSWEN